MSKKTFLKGAAVLTVANMLSRILGFFYRIPVGIILGSIGLGYLNQSFQVYNMLLGLSSSGLNVAVAKLVSEKRALNDYRGARKVFKTAFFMLSFGGLLSALIVFLGARRIVEIGGNSKAYYAMVALAPALIFVPIMSALRGYFQGRQDMVPTAMSQVIEQLGRVIVGLALAYYLLGYGIDVASGGASFGSSVGAMIGALLIGGIYLSKRRVFREELKEDANIPEEPTGKIIKRILNISIPLSIGAIVVPTMNFVDIIIIHHRLQDIGYSITEATDYVGQMSMGQTVINFALAFSVAMTMSLVPVISDYYTKKNFNQIRKIIRSGVRIGLLVGLPAALGISVLAAPIMKLLYFKQPLVTLESAGSILQISAFQIIFLTLVYALTGILQGMGKVVIPIKNLAVGGAIKLILSYVLIGIPSIAIKGAAISTVIAYAAAAILDYRAVKSVTQTEMKFSDILTKPIVAVGVMTAVVKGFYMFVNPLIGNAFATIVAIIVGMAVYALALLTTGALTGRDLNLVPGGKKIMALLKKIGLLRG